MAESCLIAENSAGTYGGGVYVGSTGTFDNCTISANEAAVQGSGVYFQNDGTLRNSIVYFNTEGAGNNIHIGGGSVDVTQSCTIPPVLGSGNFTNDPAFASPDDYHITATSPCIDAGTNLAWMAEASDIDRQTRLYNDVVDCGADEAVIEAASSFKSGMAFTSEWRTVIGAAVQLQGTHDLLHGGWTNVGGVVTSTTHTLVLPLPTNSAPVGYYRLLWFR